MKLTFVAIFCVLQALSNVEPVTLECDFDTGGYDHFGTIYLCMSHQDNISDSSDDHTITAINGLHDPGKNNADVTALRIYGNNRFSFFPRGASHFFPNLKMVYFNHMTFETLNGDELGEFPALEYFGIVRSKLVSVPSMLFQSTPNVAIVDFFENRIQRVGHDLFTPLNVSRLQRVSFESNKCIDREAGEGNTTAIRTLIDDIRVSCPFDDKPEQMGTIESGLRALKEIFG